jgi:hypothetical protein
MKGIIWRKSSDSQAAVTYFGDYGLEGDDYDV